MILTGIVEPVSEDGGHALIAEIDDPYIDEFFIRLQSWADKLDDNSHKIMRELTGKKISISITIEE